MSMPEATAPADEQAEAARELLGKVISERYRVDEVLGTGGMGAVYRAEHLLMHKRVAIKVLHPEMTRLPEVVQRFEREAMAAGHIEHPNVATAYDFGKLDNGSCFLVLEFVEGKSLRDVMLDEGAMAPERAVHITRQILQGLSRAHGLGIVHRDLKPENVMLVQRDGDPNFVKVLDFGIAKVPVGQLAEAASAPVKAQTKALTQLGMVYGTPEYMAPEQALGQEVDHRADLYAVGVMLFEMLIGERPFNAPSPVQILGMVMSKPVPAFADVAPDKAFPPGVEEFTRKLLAKVPDERFPDARAALGGIEAMLPGPSSMGSSGGWPQAATARGASPTSPGGHGALDTSMRVAEPAGSRPSLKLPPALAALPRPALIGGGVGLVALLFGLVMLLRGGSDSKKGGVALVPSGSSSAEITPEPPPVPKLSDDEIKEASTKGVEALEALHTKAPSDPRVLRALSKAQADAKQTAAALKSLEDLAGVDKEGMADRQVRAVVTQLALAEKDPSAVLASAADGKLGFAGPDALYDLTLNPKAPAPLKKKASDLLTKAQDSASPALKTALGLRKIVSGGKQGICGQAPALKTLFNEAKEQGDMRAMPFLSPLTDTKGCGFFLRKTDCYGCIRGDNSLFEAVTKIREREKENK